MQDEIINQMLNTIETTLPYTTSSLSKVAWTKPVYHLSLLENSSGYKQTLREKKLQLTELQFYTNNIARCIGIMDILYTSGKDHQFNTLKTVLLYHKSIIYK